MPWIHWYILRQFSFQCTVAVVQKWPGNFEVVQCRENHFKVQMHDFLEIFR